jgi:hypothetical protein
MTPGKKVAFARSLINPRMSSQKLAAELNVNEATLRGWESRKGGSGWPPDMLIPVSQALGVTVDWLLDPADNLPPGYAEGFRSPSHGPATGRAMFSVEGGDQLDFSEEFWINGAAHQPHFIRVQGPSQHPLLRHGDFVLVRDQEEPAPLGMFCTWRSAQKETLIRIPRYGLNGAIELHSVSPDHAPIPIPETWSLTGLVIGVKRRQPYFEMGDPNGISPAMFAM